MSNMTLRRRVKHEGKELRRKRAQNMTRQPSKASKKSQDVSITESPQKPNTAAGFLPEHIVQMLAAREK